MLKLQILFIITSYFFSVNLQSQSAETDSLLIGKYKRHISSLNYISGQTDNGKYFLNLSNNYTDSILAIEPKNSFAKDFKNKINLTLATCDQNMNHKVQLFPFFRGLPSYLGFADDPIEYAYDDALEKLLSLKYIKLQNSPISQVNITSIAVRDNCDDEMFEIVNQILTKKTNHYILPFYKIEKILGKSETKKLINGDLNEGSLALLCSQLKLDRLGIFIVNDIDVINDAIWLVDSKFTTFKNSLGFSEPIEARGFSLDKRNISLFAIFLHILESILLISFISFFDQRKKLIKIYKQKNTLTVNNFLELFINKIQFVTTCFVIPFVMSFVMIYTTSILMPSPEDHYLEASSVLWIISLTIVMSIIPTLLNLLFVNRLDLDGFHSEKGYRYFFNTSLYASYFPIFIFFTIQFDYIPRVKHILLVLITLVIAGLLAGSYYQFTAKSIHKNLKIQSVFGLILGTLALVFFNTLILSEINIQNLFYGFLIVVPISFIHYLIGKRLEVINENKLKESENVTLIKDIFISKVINPIEMIYDKITNGMSKDKLNIMILSAPMGIGKTASLSEAKIKFKAAGWNWYYGDCDEIQGEGAVTFEPFIEAFSQLLKISEFSNRHEGIEAQKSIITSAVNLVGMNTDFIADFDRNEQKPMTEICIDIIDKLESLEKKTVFVMEDLHWIDPESYSFLKHFIDIINNNKFLRGNLCIILTLRDGLNTNYRGVAHQGLIDDLEAINDDSDNKFLIEELLSTKDFNLFDFVKHLSDQNNKFKIQSYSMNQINTIFNDKLNENNDVAVLTPLYILKVIEGWIEDETLKYTPDGYLLTKNLNINDLPNSKEVDGYYHSIFKSFEPKWQRLLESAVIIGNKFDADILAKVWGYELLDILAFLETAVKNKLLNDVSEEDNLYEFTDKRIISAIKSFFSVSEDEISDKQIVIEYNKRYIATQENIIRNSHLYTIQDLLRVTRRLTTLSVNNTYYEHLQKLILEIVIRFLEIEDFDNLNAFSQFFKDKKGLKLISYIIESLAITSNDKLTPAEREARYEDVTSREPFLMVKDFNFENELLIILKLYYKERLLNEKELDFINKKAEGEYREFVLLNIIIKISNEKRDFKYSFKLLNDFLEKNKNSVNFDYYNRKIQSKYLWSHTLNNMIIVNEKKYQIGRVNPYFGTWPESVKELTDLEIIKKGYLLLENSSDAFTNENIIALLLDLFSKNNMKNETIKLHAELYNYIPNESQNLKLIIGLNIRLIANPFFTDLTHTIQNNVIKFIDDYIKKRYNSFHFNNLIKSYAVNKLRFYKKTKQLILYKLLADSYLKRVQITLGEANREYADVCSKYVEYFELVLDDENALKWLDKRIQIYGLIPDNKKDVYLKDSILVDNLTEQFLMKSYNSGVRLKRAKKYALNYLKSCDENHENYGDKIIYCAFIFEKLKEFSKSAQYFDMAVAYFNSSNQEDKDWRSAYYSLRSALNQAEIELDRAEPKLEEALSNILSDKFKMNRAERHAVFIKKAELILKR